MSECICTCVCLRANVFWVLLYVFFLKLQVMPIERGISGNSRPRWKHSFKFLMCTLISRQETTSTTRIVFKLHLFVFFQCRLRIELNWRYPTCKLTATVPGPICKLTAIVPGPTCNMTAIVSGMGLLSHG